MSQTIDLAAAVSATFNGTDLGEIKLNSASCWTKPSSGPPDGPMKFVFAPGVCAGDPPIPNGSFPFNGDSHCFMNDGELHFGNANTASTGANVLANNGWHLEGAAVRVWKIFNPCTENPVGGTFSWIEDQTSLIIENGRLKPCNKRLYYRTSTYNSYLGTWITNHYQWTAVCGPVPGDPSKDACSWYAQTTSLTNQTGTTIAALPSTATDGGATGWKNTLRWDPVNLTLTPSWASNQPSFSYYSGVYNGVGFAF